MTTRSITDHAVSIRARLLNHAKQHGDNYNRILTRYAIERLLYRLSQTEATDRYVLKGAMLFATWPEHVFRPTGDLDLLGDGDPEPAALAELFSRICQVETTDDGIIFDPASLKVEPVREADKYQGARLALNATLASAKIRVLVDVAFGDHVYPAPTRRTFPNLLADMPAANILMYPPETVVAEKFQVMISLGVANTRIKDFHDIWITTKTFEFDLANLVEAVGGTLRRRDTASPAETPIALTATFAKIAEEKGLWTGFLRRNPPTSQPPPFSDVQETLRRFFGPIIAGLAAPEAAKGKWNPYAGTWSQD
jgi:hypothetical protein